MTHDTAVGPYHLTVHAARTPDKAAIVDASTGTEYSFRQLEERSARLAGLLRSWGCHTGDHVTYLLENRAECAEAAWAPQRCGLHYTPLNIQLQVGELAWIINDCAARVVITSHAQAETAAQLRVQCPSVEHWLMMDEPIADFESYEPAIAAAAPIAVQDESDGSPMIYSSGTTGRPKGIKRPLSGLPPGETLAGNYPSVATAYMLTDESVSLVPVPAYHSAGLTRMMLSQSVGGTAVLIRKFDAEETLAIIERYGVTNAIFVPTMFVRMLRLDEPTRHRYDLSSMIAVTVGTAPSPPLVKKEMIEWWGPIISESYGGTEGNGMTLISSEDWVSHPGSVGQTVFGTLHIVRDDGSEAAPREVGVIYFEGGKPFEYYKDPDKTASVRTKEGWSTLGDVGYVDEEGYLYITDRVADVIISGGLNIYSREVEECLLAHPDVDDVAVIGVPNEEFGEEVKAVVTLRPHADAGDEEAEALRLYCREQLAHYKCPRSFDFVAELPRQANGKLYKRLLRDQYKVSQ